MHLVLTLLLAQALTAIDVSRVTVSAPKTLLVVDVDKIDGEPAGKSRHYESLLTAGFIQGYRGLVLRRPRAGAMIA